MEFLATIASVSMDGRSTCVTLWIVRVILLRKSPLIHCKFRNFRVSDEGWRFPWHCTRAEIFHSVFRSRMYVSPW